MAKNSGKQPNEKKDESDALFKLPLSEFIAARKTLAAELKKAGRASEADRVKVLAKPSISAWAANQLYWQHRDAFDELISTGQLFREAQTSGRAAKVADMREALDARREALAELSDLATALLKDAGSSPTPETIHRITTTLEAMSAYATLPDAQRPGRLSRDVDPPGFESFASLIPAGGMTMNEEPVRVTSSQRPATVASQKSAVVAKVGASVRRKVEPASEPSRAEQTRQAKIAAAKVSLQEYKSSLAEARAKAQSLDAAQKKAEADAKQAEKQKREAEERFEKARVAAQEAGRNARYLQAEAEAAAKAVEVATRSVERAAKELERLFGQ